VSLEMPAEPKYTRTHSDKAAFGQPPAHYPQFSKYSQSAVPEPVRICQYLLGGSSSISKRCSLAHRPTLR
jgi:hypothetical protein